MARTFVRAAGRYLVRASAVVTATPFSVSMWVKSTNDASQQYLFSIGNSSVRTWALSAGGNATGDPFQLIVNSSVEGATSTGYSTGTWHHFLGVFASSTDRRVYIDGGSKGTDSTSIVPAFIGGVTKISLAAEGASNGIDGDIAEVGVWSVALSDADAVLLSTNKYAPPLVETASLEAYWPLIADDDDASGNGLHMTAVNSPTFGTHVPDMVYSLGSPIPVFVNHYRQLGSM